MKKLPNKYIPFICLLFSFFIYWLDGEIIGEGVSHDYFFNTNHVWIRFCLRVLFTGLFFIFGYIGLNAFVFKWLNKIWVIVYLILLPIELFYKLYVVILHKSLPGFILDFLSSIILTFFSPFPFMCLLLIALLVQRKKM